MPENMIFQELYPDMYKLHESNQINSEPEKQNISFFLSELEERDVQISVQPNSPL